MHAARCTKPQPENRLGFFIIPLPCENQKRWKPEGSHLFLLCRLGFSCLFVSRHPLDHEQDDKDSRPDKICETFRIDQGDPCNECDDTLQPIELAVPIADQAGTDGDHAGDGGDQYPYQLGPGRIDHQ